MKNFLMKKLIENNLNDLKEDFTPVVLIGTGSYNPVHKMHIEIFNNSKSQLIFYKLQVISNSI
jgi:hypothetical protein